MHLITQTNCSPIQTSKIINTLANRKYPIKGFREGYCIPHISEIRTWNIRIKEEAGPMALSDMRCQNFLNPEALSNFAGVMNEYKGLGRVKKFILKTGVKIFRQVLKFANIHNVEYTTENNIKLADGWYQNYFLGAIKDPERGMGEEL